MSEQEQQVKTENKEGFWQTKWPIVIVMLIVNIIVVLFCASEILPSWYYYWFLVVLQIFIPLARFLYNALSTNNSEIEIKSCLEEQDADLIAHNVIKKDHKYNIGYLQDDFDKANKRKIKKLILYKERPPIKAILPRGEEKQPVYQLQATCIHKGKTVYFGLNLKNPNLRFLKLGLNDKEFELELDKLACKENLVIKREVNYTPDMLGRQIPSITETEPIFAPKQPNPNIKQPVKEPFGEGGEK